MRSLGHTLLAAKVGKVLEELTVSKEDNISTSFHANVSCDCVGEVAHLRNASLIEH